MTLEAPLFVSMVKYSCALACSHLGTGRWLRAVDSAGCSEFWRPLIVSMAHMGFTCHEARAGFL